MAMPSSIESQQQEVSGENDNETYSFASQLVMGTFLPMALQTACELGILEIIAKAGPGPNSPPPILQQNCLARTRVHQSWWTVLPGFWLATTCCAALWLVLRDTTVYPQCLTTSSLTKMLCQLKYAVLGGIAFNRVHGAHAFEYPGLDDRFNQVFNTAMLNLSTMFTKKLLHSYDGFHGIKQLVDVGGNLGITLHYITSKYPNINGINFDLPHVIQHASSYP
ncbi:hypothetical protein Goarm_006694, partial [Gossypium armourianum]|nr:hypothetical protein [Gossypium armourianum]